MGLSHIGKVVTVEYLSRIDKPDEDKRKLKSFSCTGVLECFEVAGGEGFVALDSRIIPWKDVLSIDVATTLNLLSPSEKDRYSYRVLAQKEEASAKYSPDS